MRAVLTEHEKLCIDLLIAKGLFSKITVEKLEIGKGIIIAPCSDGDQFDDVYSHIAGVCRDAVATNRIHPVALNGGAILMSGHLPQEQNADGNTMLRNILAASEIKGIEDVFLYTHFPCAIARQNEIGMVEQGVMLLNAKSRLKKENLRLRIRCFFHLDLFDETENGTHKRRTYFMSKQLWTRETLTEILHKLRGEF